MWAALTFFRSDLAGGVTMATKSADVLDTSFASRFPNSRRVPRGQSGNVDSLSASAEAGSLDTVQAMAVKGFAAVSGKLVWVRAKQHFYQNFEIISAGDFVQIPEDDAKRLVNAGKAEMATDADVAAAQKASK